jgi:hypothetical protein
LGRCGRRRLSAGGKDEGKRAESGEAGKDGHTGSCEVEGLEVR